MDMNEQSIRFHKGDRVRSLRSGRVFTVVEDRPLTALTIAVHDPNWKYPVEIGWKLIVKADDA